MPIRPHRPTTILPKLEMMHQPQHRLEKQQHKHNDPDDGVIMIEQVDRHVPHNIDPDPECHAVNHVCEDLEYSVDEPETAEGAEAD